MDTVIAPCKICLVRPMCSENCSEHQEYVRHVIEDLCFFTIYPKYDLSQRIRIFRRGEPSLGGYFTHKHDSVYFHAIVILYEDYEIIAVYRRKGKFIYFMYPEEEKPEWRDRANAKIEAMFKNG